MKVTDYLSKSRNFYGRRLAAKFNTPIGASEFEVSEMERELCITFPLAYRQFLFWMGKDKHGALKGSEWFIDDLRGNQDFLGEFLDENTVKGVTGGKRVCFFSHQGYMAAWFSADANEPDPKCQFYSESNLSQVAIETGPFSQFLLKELKSVVEMLRLS